jgi:4-amino-4-deoxy-L-arabinose transferase-like glycosyltransferase
MGQAQMKKTHQIFLILALVVTFVALALRLYNIADYQTFLGDEGRDVRIVSRFLKEGDLMFIGPQTSIGGMYLGPFYYYLMAIPLLISNFDPIGPAIMVATLSALTVFLIYYLGRHWVGHLGALVAAFLYAIAPVTIVYGQSSWNPNPVPLFALLLIHSLNQVLSKHLYHHLILIALYVGIISQLHYLGLLLIPISFIVWLITLRRSRWLHSLFRYTALAVIVFAIFMSPLLLFDIKHDWMNARAFGQFFGDRQTTVNLNPINSNRFVPVIDKTTSDILLGQSSDYGFYLGLFLLLIQVIRYLRNRSDSDLILLVWLVIGWLGLGVYKQHIYAHYFGFLFPLFFLLVGGLTQSAHKLGKPTFLMVGLLLALLTYHNVSHGPYLKEPNRQLARTKQVVETVMRESGGQPFNFGLIAKQNYDESYRYFFETYDAPLVRGEDGLTDQLFVVCEDKDCQPEGHPQYQIAIFGPSKVYAQWQIDHIRIYHMLPTP